MATNTNVAPRPETSAQVYKRQLGNRGRAVLADALERVITGDASKWTGTNGRTFADELAMQLINDPLGSLMRIDTATRDERESKSDAPGSNINIQAMYLTAVQQAQPKVIEGIIGVQGDLTDW